MNCLHVISSLRKLSGGPALSSFTLVAGLREEGVKAAMVTFQPKDINEELIANESFIHVLPFPRLPKWQYSKHAILYFKENLEKNDLIHIHGLWEFLPHQAAKAAYTINKPYILTIRGMLYQEALNNSSSFKKIAAFLFQKKDLSQAAVLHATCKQEYNFIRSYGLKNPVAIIPNPLELPEELPKIAFKSKAKIRIGFIGRFNAIKNIESLIDAWALLCAKNSFETELVLVGDGDPNYKLSLENRVKSLKLSNVIFTGFLNGEKKNEMFSSLHYLILPSKSENFGMVVTEALLRGIPVIASHGTPWEDLEKFNCGWWVNNDVNSLYEAMLQAMNTKEEERLEMGKRGQDLVVEKYGQTAVAVQMKELYCWVLDPKLPVPMSVNLN